MFGQSKSSTRDILHQLLAQIGDASASFGNWNSIPGIAMCVASLPPQGDFAVIEIGGGGVNPRSRVLDLILHDDAIITTIGISDTSKFPTPAVTAEVKSRLFQSLPPSGRAYWSHNVAEVDILMAAADGHQVRVVGDPTLTTSAN